MTVVLAAAMFALMVAMLMYLIRAALGPTVYDRVLATNAFGTKTVLFVALIGFFNGRPDFLDIALVYATVNFATTVAILKLVQDKRLDA